MHETDDTKILKKYDAALELLLAEKTYTEERLADKRSSIAKTKYLTLNLARIERDIVNLNENRAEVTKRVNWELSISTNLAQ